ncbi:MAG: histidine kinase [Zoogloeaceae bacterium]|jgi:PAS domain S-box-containing protein|nr:histidine kinase [Zoogloeaceae bacterium]
MPLRPSEPVSALNLLILAAAAAEAAQVAARFERATYSLVTDASGLHNALRGGPWDAVLYLDALDDLSPVQAIRSFRNLSVDLPFVVIADPADGNFAGRMMRLGAHDVIFRDRMGRLAPAVEREVREARYRADQRATLAMVQNSDLRFRGLADSLPGMVFHLQRSSDGSYRFLYVSEGSERLFGIRQHQLLTSPKKFFEAFDTDDRRALETALAQSATAGTPLDWSGRLRGRSRGGRWVELRSAPKRNDDSGHGIVNWQGIATNITAVKETEAALRASREQLSELSFHLEAAREQERERIARDIHDELGSLLVRLKIEATLLTGKLPTEPPLLRDKARSIESLLDQAMAAASRVARELRPGILKEFGLPAAIESLAEDFAQHFDIACRVHCDDDLDPDPDTSLALFRIVQETLTNVAKHAHASLAVVRLKREKGGIVLELRDNGRGISEADMAKPKSFGLRGIRERVHSLSGEFAINAGEHGGTHIRLRVPERRGAEASATEETEDLQRKLF